MEKLTLHTLETKLWDCADILRGTLNSTQYMEYIFGMLFLKRINDQFQIEREEKVERFAKLEQLIKIFDGMKLSNEDVESPDILGDAYMYLIKK